MIRTLIEGFLLGLSTGTICLVTCTPIYLPYLLTEKRQLKKSLIAVFQISVGRFFSYAAFGAAAGFTGSKIAGIDRSFYASIAYILLSVYLVLTTIRTHKKHHSCSIPKYTRFTRNAILLGVLTGLNFCPSFLIALSKSIDLGGIMAGTLLFTGFFFGTSVFLIPLAFVGLLTKVRNMTNLARVASVIIAVWFLYSGGIGLYKHFTNTNYSLEKGKRIVEVFAKNTDLIICSDKDNLIYFKSLQDSIYKNVGKKTKLITNCNNMKFHKNTVLIIDSKLLNMAEKENVDYFSVQKGYNINRIINFLDSYSFKTAKHIHWKFDDNDN